MGKNLLLLAENISISFGARMLFHIKKLEIYEGDRIGLVGLNGSGKTTLLRLLSGEILPDEGAIRVNCKPQYFTQQSNDIPHQVDSRELRLFGVQDLIDNNVVSGGEGTRLRLAELFSKDSPLFLLDEPTSHLDEEGQGYLNHRLASIDSFVLVSHDRELLDKQCNIIIEIAAGDVKIFQGNYSFYCEQKKQALNRAYLEYEQYVDEMKRLKKAYHAKKEQARKTQKKPRNISTSDAKTRDYCAARRSHGSKAKNMERSAENIKKRMEHMEVKEKPQEFPKLRPIFNLTDPPENPIIIEADNLSFTYANGKEIFRNAVFRLQRGSHTVLVGKNGVGKTTLIRLIIENKIVRVVPKVKIGYLQQDLSNLSYEDTVLENVMKTSVQSSNIVRITLARLLFTPQDIYKPVSMLSGGELIRLAFAKIFVSNANVLILDEPTNYLDIPSIESIQSLLSEYEGTLLFTSHDRAFIKAIATNELLIYDKKIFQSSLDEPPLY